MAAHKKHPSVRRRQNKAATQATLTRPALRSVEDLSDLTVVEIRAQCEPRIELDPGVRVLAEVGEREGV